MKRFVFILFCVICAAAVGAAYWFFRPGAEFSPREVMAMSSVEDRREPYRMMDRIYPSSAIQRPEVVTTFPRNEQPIDIRYRWNGEEHGFEDYAERRAVQGLYVLKDGEVVLERYLGDAGPQDRFTSWSVAKSVVSSLIGIAVMDGKIDSLDDEVQTYAPEYAGTDYGRTSIRHLLMMASGIDFNENYEERGSDIRKLFFNTFLLNRDVDETVRAFERARPAGEQFNYISTNTQVLSAVLRGAYGRSLISVFNEKLAQPLGLTGGSWLTDRKGRSRKELGYCCLQLTLEDYAKLGQLYVQDGMVGNIRVLPQGWAEFVGENPTPTHRPSEDGALGYGHHFWTIGGDDGAITMQGYDGQFVHIDREDDVVIVMVSADRHIDYAGLPEFPQLFAAIKDELR
jgi:CubicO group peptidase (beta-lactamase class C family)